MGAARRGGEGFRAQPPDVAGTERIARPRLIAALAQRFDRRLTLMTAVAGAGKTTTLALAMEANQMQARGADIWVAADERDREPGVLIESIAQALNAPLGGDAVLSIADAVWARAPDDLAIIVDDVHHLIGYPAEKELADLLQQLPRNGHMVLAGRRLPAIPIARMRAQDAVVEIDNDDLLLSDDELNDLVTRRRRSDLDLVDFPRVAGLADLTLRFGHTAGAEFIWEEVLASLEASHLEHLRIISMFDEFDDVVARAITGTPDGAVPLVASLPLVDRESTGVYRFHALLRSALIADLSAQRLTSLRVRAAEHAAALGDRALAVRLFSLAGDADQAMAAARSFVLGSSLRRTLAQLRTVHDAVLIVAPDSGLVAVLDAEIRLGQFSRGTSHVGIVADFARAAELARADGDHEVEATALYRAIQQASQHSDLFDGAAVERLEELADVVPYAAQVVRYARAVAKLGSSDADGAMAAIAPVDDVWDPISEQVFRAGMLCALGRFEDVAPDLEVSGDQTVAPAANAYHGYAMYFRGDVLPEIGLTVHDETSHGISAARIVSPEIVTCSVMALMGAQADDADVAEASLERAEHAATWGCAPSVRAHITAARAVAVMCFADESAARAVVAGLLADVPVGRWPSAAHLTALDLIYLFAPDVREALDRCTFGAAQTVAIDAARAVIEIRRTGSSPLLGAFPWQRHGVMRVQVAPPLLVELAATAAVTGVGAARDLIATVPGAERHLRRVAASDSPSAAHAENLLEDWPTPPAARLRVNLIGPLAVRRNDEALHHPDFDRRIRVQELLAVLVEHRRMTRQRLGDLLWPDLDPKKAAGNLRVTLAYLNRALEPERTTDDAPFCIRSDGDFLILHESIESDLDDFDRAVRQATTYDRAGAPRAALERYRAAVDLWRGDYLEQMQSAWIEPTRERVRFAVVNAILRVGELTLARGEPEEALDWALRARTLAPLHDRAERLNASCRLATGDRAGAAAALRDLADGLSAVGMRLEIESERLLARLVDAP